MLQSPHFGARLAVLCIKRWIFGTIAIAEAITRLLVLELGQDHTEHMGLRGFQSAKPSMAEESTTRCLT
jgi:hypothetical protein